MIQKNLGSGFPLDKKFERHLKRYINCDEIRSLKKNFGMVPDFYKRKLEWIRRKLSRKYPYWTEDLTFLVIISEILFHWNNYESFRNDLTIKQPYLWQGAGEILDAWNLAKRNPFNIESITIAVRGSRRYTLQGVAREGLSKVKKEKDPVLRKFNIQGTTPVVLLTKSIEQNITELRGLAKWEKNLKSKKYNEIRGKKG